MPIKIYLFLFLLISLGSSAFSQGTELRPGARIGTVQLYKPTNQQSLPFLILGKDEKLTLSFDDLDGGIKNYYYTYVLCDYNWNPVNISSFEYLKGLNQNRISTYRNSSLSRTRYTHYTVQIPEMSFAPSKAGNYLVKVYLDGDTAKTVFTKRLLVVDLKASIIGQMVQPLAPQYFSTYQRIKFVATLGDLNAFSVAQQVKAVILQNNRWDNAIYDLKPTFVRGKNLEFNQENTAMFPAGTEWRWLDLRSFRLLSDRVYDRKERNDSIFIDLEPDTDRRFAKYRYFPDYNGMFNISTLETINPLWQAEYATVYFHFATPDGKPLPGKDLYLAGGFTNFQFSPTWKMKWNAETRLYEGSAYLKQGYYNYTYITTNTGSLQDKLPLENNYWETENQYTILLYYKSFSDRYDQLIGIGSVQTRFDRPGFSF